MIYNSIDRKKKIRTSTVTENPSHEGLGFHTKHQIKRKTWWLTKTKNLHHISNINTRIET